MNFLNKALAQFNDLFRSMTPGGRITAGLLLVVAVVSVGYLFQHQVGGGDDYLFEGVSIQTPTLLKMQDAFGKANLNGFTIEGGRIKVPHAQRAAYLAALADAHALPPNCNDIFQDAVQGSNPFESPTQHAERLKVAKQQAMAESLSHMTGIESADVFIDQDEKAPFGQPKLKTASIRVQTIGGVPLTDDQVDSIRYLVVGANAGTKAENVMISDGSGMVYPVSEVDRGGNSSGDYARAVKKAEQDLNENVKKALSHIPGVKVVSMVTLDREKSHILEVKTDPKAVPVRQVENNTTLSRESTTSGGAPGLAAQGGAMVGNSLGPNNGKGPSETSEKTQSEIVSVPSTTSTETDKFPLTPKLAKVSVGIPASYFEKVLQGQGLLKEGEKPDQAVLDKTAEDTMLTVRNTVATLLPATGDAKDPTALVTVTKFQDIKPAEIVGPAMTQRAMSWLGDNWPMLAMVGLVLFSLNMLRSMMRSAPAQPPAPAAVSARVNAAESSSPDANEPVEAAAARRLRRAGGTGPSLRDELSEIVKEDPDSAANILRSWIGQVS